MRPAAADAALAEIFQVPMGTPLLNMEEVDYDIDGRPVFCSSEYFVDGIFRHTVMRKNSEPQKGALAMKKLPSSWAATVTGPWSKGLYPAGRPGHPL